MTLETEVLTITAVAAGACIKRPSGRVAVMLCTWNFAHRTGPALWVEANALILSRGRPSREEPRLEAGILGTGLTVCLRIVTSLAVQPPALRLKAVTHDPVGRMETLHLCHTVMTVQAVLRCVAGVAARLVDLGGRAVLVEPV